MKFAVLFLSSLLLLISCCKEKPKPTVHGRYFKRDSGDLPDDVRVEIIGMSIPVNNPTKKKNTFSSLSPTTQVAAIEAFTKDSTAFKKHFVQLLNPKQKSPKVYFKEFFTFKRRLLLSVKNSSLTPADRIANATIKIELPEDSPIEFRGCSQIETVYGTISYGNLNLNQTRTTTFGVNASYGIDGGTEVEHTNNRGLVPGSVPESPTFRSTSKNKTTANINKKISGNYSKSSNNVMSESASYSRRYIKMSVSMTGKKLEIYLEGARGIDLSGNVTVDVVLKATQKENSTPCAYYKFMGLGKKPVQPEIGSINAFPLNCSRLEAREYSSNLSIEYTMRHVKKGHETIPEYDDHVIIKTVSTTPAKLVLVRKAHSSPRLYAIQVDGKYVHIGRTPKHQELLLLETYEDARQLIEKIWDIRNLKTQKPKPAGRGKKQKPNPCAPLIFKYHTLFTFNALAPVPLTVCNFQNPTIKMEPTRKSTKKAAPQKNPPPPASSRKAVEKEAS